MVTVIGIDPGATGAIALVAGHPDGKAPFAIVQDMPTMKIKRGSRHVKHVDAATVAAVLRFLINESDLGISGAFIERVGAMPGQGVSSMFAFGRAVGVLEGALAGLEVPVTMVTPQEWRRGMRVKEGKDGSRARAAELLPAMAGKFARVEDHGRAEAILIALYGLQMTQGMK